MTIHWFSKPKNHGPSLAESSTSFGLVGTPLMAPPSRLSSVRSKRRMLTASSTSTKVSWPCVFAGQLTVSHPVLLTLPMGFRAVALAVRGP
eukprot:CAMPEP_0184378424 /NCGR_PEP_ID=MMETSP0007-20130409/3057_1 /TAXON_ID=97485 /ORGANISM="Prymnesium parvum, Strain Texoma1" /LENGTH=90 /DNA_ID=CAMNT_0026722709 /DNA_START=985 /DNA_END=1253 /DNA_ORIENTATION=-